MDDFSSCNYLGLEEREDVFEAVMEAHRKWGLQRWPTRSVVVMRPTIDLESRLADLIGVPGTLIFPTVTLLHMGILPLLAADGGHIVIDSEAHKSMHEASLLAKAKGAQVGTFRHGDIAHLRHLLASIAIDAKKIIVVDGVYSMSGEILDVKLYQALAQEFGATLYIDDAHGFGVLGETPDSAYPFGFRGNGVVKFSGCNYDNIVYVAGTAKAHSTTMAFISYDSPKMRELLERASTMVFGHSVPVAIVAQATAALDINDLEGDETRRRLFDLTQKLLIGAKRLGLEVSSSMHPVVKITLGSLSRAIAANQILWDHGIMLTPAIFPAAPLDQGGLRLTVTATNTESQIDRLLEALSVIANSDTRDEHLIDLTQLTAVAR